MKIFYGIKNIKKDCFIRPVVCIGIFDGVHIGHKNIIKTAIKRTKQIKGQSVLLTFYPHPLWVLSPASKIPLLISLAHRLRLFQQLGVALCIVVNFNRRFAMVGPESFVKKFLIDKIGARKVIVGSDFIFGKDRSGDVKLLKNLAESYGFSLEVVELTRYKGEVVSSTRIRNLIERGKLEEAECLLGRPVSILGTVIRGTMRGRLIGYPTANIDPHHEVIPPKGVYAVLIKMNDKVYKGLLNIGIRPTFNKFKVPATKLSGSAKNFGGKSSKFPPQNVADSPRILAKKVLTVEAHIFGFNKKIYGEDIEVSFLKKIRDEKRFSNKYELIQQIRQDEIAAKSILR